MSELIVREITPRDRPAKYGNVDLGSKENFSRGAATAGLRRDIPGGTHQICITTLIDTYHNRITLLEKSRTSKNPVELFIRTDDDKLERLQFEWMDTLFGDMEAQAAKLAPSLPAGYSEDAFDPMDHHPDGTTDIPITVALDAGKNPEKVIKDKPQPGPKTAAKEKKAPAQKAPKAQEQMPAADEEFTIRSVGDFLGLPMRAQMMALEAGMPAELLQEIATSDSPSLEMDVKNEAFRRLSE